MSAPASPSAFAPRSGLTKFSCVNVYIQQGIDWPDYLDHMRHFYGRRAPHADLARHKPGGATFEQFYASLREPDCPLLFVHPGKKCGCEAFARAREDAGVRGKKKLVYVSPHVRAFLVPVSGAAAELHIPAYMPDGYAKMAAAIKRAVGENDPRSSVDYMWWPDRTDGEWMIAFADMSAQSLPLNTHCAEVPGMPALRGAFVLLHGRSLSSQPPSVAEVFKHRMGVPAEYEPAQWKEILLRNRSWAPQKLGWQYVSIVGDALQYGNSTTAERDRRNPWHQVMMADFLACLQATGVPVEHRRA